MGKLILYGFDLSPPVRAVKLTLKALNIDYDYVIVNPLAKDQMKPEYIEMNPQHTIPTINDNGHIVWDSHVICTYLVQKYGKDEDQELYPKNLEKRTIVDQRLHFNNSIIWHRLGAIVSPIIQQNATEITEEAITNALKAFDFIELFLKNSSYIAGDCLTVADFCCAATISTILNVIPDSIGAERFPKLLDWFKLLEQLPYYSEFNGLQAIEIGKFIKGKLEANKKSTA